jgi:hypothetical protein
MLPVLLLCTTGHAASLATSDLACSNLATTLFLALPQLQPFFGVSFLFRTVVLQPDRRIQALRVGDDEGVKLSLLGV